MKQIIREVISTLSIQVKVLMKQNNFCIFAFFAEGVVYTFPSTIVNFLGGIRSLKVLFCELENDYLGPKLVAILTWPKRPCDITGCISITDTE